MEQEKQLNGLATVWPEEEGQAPQTVYFQPPKKKKYPVEWLNLWQNVDTGVSMTEQAEMEKPLTQTEYRVRDWLMGTIGIGNYVYVNQAEMCRRLRIDKKNASIAIKRLIELGILLRGPKSGRNNTYMVSPAFCFKGSLGEGVQVVNQAAKEHKKAKILQFQPLLQKQGSLV